MSCVAVMKQSILNVHARFESKYATESRRCRSSMIVKPPRPNKRIVPARWSHGSGGGSGALPMSAAATARPSGPPALLPLSCSKPSSLIISLNICVANCETSTDMVTMVSLRTHDIDHSTILSAPRPVSVRRATAQRRPTVTFRSVGRRTSLRRALPWRRQRARQFRALRRRASSRGTRRGRSP